MSINTNWNKFEHVDKPKGRRFRKTFIEESIPIWDRKDRSPKYWHRLRLKILIRDNHTCRMCKAKEPECGLEVHHIQALFKGGNHQNKNLMTLCHDCHKKLTSLDYYKGVYDNPVPVKTYKDLPFTPENASMNAAWQPG